VGGPYLVVVHESGEAAVDDGIEQRGADRHHDDEVEDVLPCESHARYVALSVDRGCGWMVVVVSLVVVVVVLVVVVRKREKRFRECRV
jgi:hypothetical protein